MALQYEELGIVKVEPWHDLKGEEEARKLVDEIEPRIDSDIQNVYNCLQGNSVFIIRCPEHKNPLILAEIKKRYHSWNISVWRGSDESDRLVFNAKQPVWRYSPSV